MSLYSDVPSYFNTTVYVTCQNGYTLNGDEKRICNDQKVWEGVSSCQIVHCASPRLPKHALYIEKDINGSFIKYSGSKFYYLDKIRVVCSEGYTLNKTSTVRQCLENKEWSGEADHCIQVTCMELEELKYGQYRYSQLKLFDRYPYNTTVVATCNVPFQLSPSNKSRKCSSKGEWDNEQFLCIQRSEGAVQEKNVPLIGCVSAADVAIFSILVVVVFFIHHRKKKNDNKNGKQNQYEDLKRSDNFRSTQDGVYSEIQETRFSSKAGNLADRTKSEMKSSPLPRDALYINLTEKETDKNMLKHSNQSSVSLHSNAYYSFSDVDNVPESATQ